ncbi:MAG: cupin domain-containing protein [Candidatus Azotimanducaceae bacterium WSBS_2022_MAG_OTU7]
MDHEELRFPNGPELGLALVSETLPAGGQLEFGSGFFSAGTRSPESGFHVRDVDEYSLVLDGEFTVWSGGKEYNVKAGEIIAVPAGEENAAEATVDSRVIYLWYTPGVPKASS